MKKKTYPQPLSRFAELKQADIFCTSTENLGSFTTSGNWTVAQTAESYNGGHLSTLKTL